MKARCIAVVGSLLLTALLGQTTSAKVSNTKSAKAPASADGGTLRLLSTAGVKSADQVAAVVVMYPNRCTYKITPKDFPDLVKRIYDSLQSVYRVPDRMPSDWASLTLVLAGGKGVWFVPAEEPPDSPSTVFLSGGYVAPELLKPIQEIRANAKASVLDAKIGDFEVNSLEVRTARSDFTPRVPVTSKEGRAIIAKARDIVDCLDTRNAWARAQHWTGYGDIASAEAKFGCVTMHLKYLIPITLNVLDEAKAPGGDPDPIGRNVSFATFRCGTIEVLDYGNFLPPVVALHDSDGPGYYVCPQLTRRKQEKHGVEKLGFPGRPISDTEYYKSPETLYKELQELTKDAYEKYKPKQ